MIFLQLAFEFLKIGLFAIGGGLAVLPFLHDLVGQYGWFTLAELADMVAVAESVPGPIGLNLAIYAGYQAAGVPGGLVAAVSLMLPSFLLALLAAGFLARFSKSRLLAEMFTGLRPAVAGLIFAISLSLVSLAVCTNAGAFPANLSLKELFLFLAMLPAVFILKKHPVIYVAAGAVIGIILKF
mgnify:CR=1 FL=1